MNLNLLKNDINMFLKLYILKIQQKFFIYSIYIDFL